jgi:hypothetical protein
MLPSSFEPPAGPARPVALAPEEPCAVSPSQLVTRRSCERKWGFQKLLGLRHETAATILGGEVHAHREAYLGTGEPIDQTTKAGLIASVGLTQIPAPGDVVVEREFAYWIRPMDLRRRDGGLYWGGIIDMLSAPGTPRADSPAFIGDHKTTSDLKYAKSEQELRDDPQWNIYVAYLFALADVAVGQTLWHYITSRKPFVSKPVWVTAKRDDKYRLAVIETLKEESREIERIRRKPPEDVNDLEPNFAACRDYGGCPFQGGVCSAGLGTFFGATAPAKATAPETPASGGSVMSDFASRIAAMKAGGASAPATAPAGAGVNPPPDGAEVKRGPGRPPGARNKPKEEGGAIEVGALLPALDTGPIVAILTAMAAEEKRHHEAMEKAATEANEIAMAALEAAATR